MRFASTTQHLPRPPEWKKQVAYQRTPPAQAGEKQRTPPFLLLGHKFVVVDFLNFWLFISGKPRLSFSFVLSFFLTHVRQVSHQHTNTPVDGDVLWKISPKKWEEEKHAAPYASNQKGVDLLCLYGGVRCAGKNTMFWLTRFCVSIDLTKKIILMCNVQYTFLFLFCKAFKSNLTPSRECMNHHPLLKNVLLPSTARGVEERSRSCYTTRIHTHSSQGA